MRESWLVIRKYMSAPVFDDEIKTRSAFLLNIVLNSSLLFLMILFAGLILGGNTPRAGTILSLIAFVWLAIFAVRFIMLSGRVETAGIVLVFIYFLITTLIVYTLGTIRSPTTSFYMVTIVMAGLVINRRVIIWMSGASILMICALLVAENNKLLPAPDLTVGITQGITFSVAFAFIAVLLFYAVSSINEYLARAKTELAERTRAEARLRVLVDNSPDYILEVDRQGDILFINRNPEIYLGKNIREFIQPDSLVSVLEILDTAFQSGQTQAFEFQTVNMAGLPTWDSVRIGPVIQAGQVTSLTVIMTDIREQKLADSALRESELRYRQAISAAGMVPYIVEYSPRSFRYIGDDIYRLTGYSVEEITPAILKSVVIEDNIWGQDANLSPDEARARFLSGEMPEWHNDMHIRTRTGEDRWLSDSSIELKDKAGKVYGAIGIFQDITNRKLAEQEIHKLNVELEKRVQERTSELEAANRELETFSFSVSHDLRAPLRGMVSFAKILDNDFSAELSPLARDFLQRIIVSGFKMNELIEGLLKFSRLVRKPLELQMVDMKAIAISVIETLAPEIASRRIEWEISELPSAMADPILIEQVFANLIGNAVKYSGKSDPAHIEIGSTKQDGQQVYLVRDNGAGFDMAYAGKLFNIFQRLHSESEFEGTGVGLATVQRIVQRHGGKIWAEAEQNKGAAFFFTLS